MTSEIAHDFGATDTSWSFEVWNSGTPGSTLAYQVAWVFFLAPYAILAQPVHTAILSDLAREADEPSAFARSLRWALDNIVLLQNRGNQVSVLGQVNRPGRFPLETVNIRLSEMIAIAGGISQTGADVAILTGVEIKGATRWVHFMGFSLQPSEFLKPAFAISRAVKESHSSITSNPKLHCANRHAVCG